ncbi:conserved hypothetical protein [[Clostridium] ultunense Esp]|nr:conserved hypothetical protein [[Clostridium] ultunense Esp]
MAANRQDAWTADEDLLLAEVTLQHIREGGTQLAAFEKAAERLGRTAAACGFRWNSTIRKEYEEAISMAKGVRKKALPPDSQQKSITFDEVFRFLKGLQESRRKNSEELSQLKKRVEDLEQENGRLREERMKLQEMNRLLHDEKHRLVEEIGRFQERNGQLLAEVENLQGELERILSLEEGYKVLLEMMERAKRKTSHQRGEGSY